MAKGSVLKNLKENLQQNELLRNQTKRKQSRSEHQKTRARDEANLNQIRQSFNPFNAKFENDKSVSGGRKRSGQPVIARSLAEKQRQQTYLMEKKLKRKVGGLVDRRFGEKSNMNEEDKMVERFAREKLNHMRNPKKSFNIEDTNEETDVLTHHGQQLEFSDFEDEINEMPPMKKHKSDELNERKKTKAEIMQEVIQKSKMHKLERQQQKAQDEQLVDELNLEFDDLLNELNSVELKERKPKREVDQYDLNVNEFAFDKRADPTSRTKTDEEIQQEQTERKKLAERAQLQRMEGDDLGVDYDNAVDDADLFGLKEVESDIEEEVEVDDTPLDLSLLADESDLYDVLKKHVSRVTPGRGTGSEQKLHELCRSITLLAVSKNSKVFKSCVRVLHEACPRFGVGLAVSNKVRDLILQVHKKPKWGKKEVMLFALVGSLFSTSDQWHVVATSAMISITKHLSNSVKVDDVCINLALCFILVDYQRVSKRFIPEVVMYILRVLAMLKQENKQIAERFVRLPVGNLPITNTDAKPLNLNSQNTNADIALTVSKLAAKCAGLWRSLDAFCEVFEPILECLKVLDLDIKGDIDLISRLMKFSKNERTHLKLQEFKPIGIVTRAPLFDENYNPDYKGYGLDPEKRELQKLKALHKKERKSTLREIRRDAEFETRQQLKDKREEMEQYHQKLKRLEGQINGEEGAEKNAYIREKRKKSRR